MQDPILRSVYLRECFILNFDKYNSSTDFRRPRSPVRLGIAPQAKLLHKSGLLDASATSRAALVAWHHAAKRLRRVPTGRDADAEKLSQHQGIHKNKINELFEAGKTNRPEEALFDTMGFPPLKTPFRASGG